MSTGPGDEDVNILLGGHHLTHYAHSIVIAAFLSSPHQNVVSYRNLVGCKLRKLPQQGSHHNDAYWYLPGSADRGHAGLVWQLRDVIKKPGSCYPPSLPRSVLWLFNLNLIPSWSSDGCHSSNHQLLHNSIHSRKGEKAAHRATSTSCLSLYQDGKAFPESTLATQWTSHCGPSARVGAHSHLTPKSAPVKGEQMAMTDLDQRFSILTAQYDHLGSF